MMLTFIFYILVIIGVALILIIEIYNKHLRKQEKEFAIRRAKFSLYMYGYRKINGVWKRRNND
jgi:hypothetical protein